MDFEITSYRSESEPVYTFRVDLAGMKALAAGMSYAAYNAKPGEGMGDLTAALRHRLALDGFSVEHYHQLPKVP